MLTSINLTAEQFTRPPAAAIEGTANNVFKVLHGAYGNLFLSKFATGVLDDKGRDMGVASARKVWAYDLRGFSESVVIDALDRCKRDKPEFPPSLPEFMDFCRACAPREAYRPALPPVAMSQEARKRHADEARAASARIKAEAVAPVPVTGLPLLWAAIADAVGCAGGDEAKELMRLERMYAGVAA